MQTAPILVTAFYKFVPLPDFTALKEPFLEQAKKHDLRGSILLAEEGINATISGEPEPLLAFLGWLKQDARFADLTWKQSYHHAKPFNRMKVRLKKEIVGMRVAGIDALENSGTYCDAAAWEALLNDPETLVIDTRNDYEVRLGTFKGAINPVIQNFREFPAWLDKNVDATKHKKIAMFCTGGIRCEKSTAYAKEQGFSEVYHLEGGILQYLEDTGNKGGLWEGNCFVFDDRVAVDAALAPIGSIHCTACGNELTTDDHKTNRENQFVCQGCRQ
jgi:UPF0176 protein